MAIKNTNLEMPMFYGASPEIFKRASELRKNMTKSESILWSGLRKKQLCGKKFRRQHPMDKFIVDFYCHECKLIIEVDGGIHNLPEQREHDDGRAYELKQLGLKIIRFTNDQVIYNLTETLKEIKKNLNLTLPQLRESEK